MRIQRNGFAWSSWAAPEIMTSSPRMPSAAKLSEIAKQHGLVGTKAQALEDWIRQIARILQTDALEPALPPGQVRAGRLDRLRRIEKGLETIAALVEPSDDGIRRLLRRIWADDVGRWLSTHAVEEGGGIGLPANVSSRTLETRQATSRAGAYRAMELAMASRRAAAAADAGEHLVAAFASCLGNGLTQYLALQRMNTGGRPADRYRKFLIQQLLAIFPDLFDAMPTTTSTGRFVRLCMDVADAIGIDSTGLEKAAQREMMKAKRTTASS